MDSSLSALLEKVVNSILITCGEAVFLRSEVWQEGEGKREGEEKRGMIVSQAV